MIYSFRPIVLKAILAPILLGVAACSPASETITANADGVAQVGDGEAREWTLTCEPERLEGEGAFDLSFYLQPEYEFVRIDAISDPVGKSDVYSGSFFDAATSVLTLNDKAMVESATSVDQRIYMSGKIVSLLESVDVMDTDSFLVTLYSGQSDVGAPVVSGVFLERNGVIRIIQTCTNLGLQAELDVHVAEARKRFPDLSPGDALVAVGPIILEPIERGEVAMPLPGIFDIEGTDLLLSVATEVSEPGVAICFSQESAPQDRAFCASIEPGGKITNVSMTVIESEPLRYEIALHLGSAEEVFVEAGELSIESLLAVQSVSEDKETMPEPSLRVVADDRGASVTVIK